MEKFNEVFKDLLGYPNADVQAAVDQYIEVSFHGIYVETAILLGVLPEEVLALVGRTYTTSRHQLVDAILSQVDRDPTSPFYGVYTGLQRRVCDVLDSVPDATGDSVGDGTEDGIRELLEAIFGPMPD